MVTSVFWRGLAIGALCILSVASLTQVTQAQDRTAAAETAGALAVGIDNFSFTPKEITVPLGSAVTWTNRDDIPHTVTASNQAFRSKVLDTDQAYTFTFSKPGTYEYFCSLHPHMTGKIIVK